MLLRALGSFGLGILFLIVSPGLRGTVVDVLTAISNWVQAYSPLSYVGIGICILAGLMFGLYCAAQPRV